MRPELERIREIDEYLDNQLSEDQLQLFRDKLEKDASLQEEVDFYRSFREGIEQNALRSEIRSATRKYLKKKKKHSLLRKYFLGGSTLLLMVIAVFIIGLPDKEDATEILPQLIDNTEDKSSYLLPGYDYYQVGNEDTVLVTKMGTRLYIPENAFTDGQDSFVLQVLEVNGSVNRLRHGLAAPAHIPDAGTLGSIRIFASNNQGLITPNRDRPLYVEMPLSSRNSIRMWNVSESESGMQWSSPKWPDNKLAVLDPSKIDYLPTSFYPYAIEFLRQKGQSITKANIDSLYFQADAGVGNCQLTPSFLSESIRENPLTYLHSPAIEKRMGLIHESCRSELIDIYSRRALNLRELDLEAAAYCQQYLPSFEGIFRELAEEHDGGLMTKAPYAQMMTEVYSEERNPIQVRTETTTLSDTSATEVSNLNYVGFYLDSDDWYTLGTENESSGPQLWIQSPADYDLMAFWLPSKRRIVKLSEHHIDSIPIPAAKTDLSNAYFISSKKSAPDSLALITSYSLLSNSDFEPIKFMSFKQLDSLVMEAEFKQGFSPGYDFFFEEQYQNASQIQSLFRSYDPNRIIRQKANPCCEGAPSIELDFEQSEMEDIQLDSEVTILREDKLPEIILKSKQPILYRYWKNIEKDSLKNQ